MAENLQALLGGVGAWAIPLAMAAIVTFGLIKRVKVYEAFVEGAKEGFNVGVRIIPYLVAILVAIGIFRASGALEMLGHALSPLLSLIGFPPEALPMALIRPLSGSGALGLMSDLVNTHGAESFVGRLSSVMMGSTETTFYVLAIYLGSVGIRKGRHTLAACLIADAAGIIAALIVCSIVF